MINLEQSEHVNVFSKSDDCNKVNKQRIYNNIEV